MVAPTNRAAASSAAFLFLAAASPSHAAPPVSPSAQSAAPGPASSGPGAAVQETVPSGFARGRPPTPAQLELLHQSLDESAPLGYASRPKYALIIAGAATFGGVYLLSAGLTAIGNGIDCILHHHSVGCGGERMLFVPVVGPLLHLAQSDQPGACFFGPVLVASSLAQLTGLTLLIVGAVIREKVPISAGNRPRYSLAPYLSTTGGGMQALVRY